jgi:hypothetical protein
MPNAATDAGTMPRPHATAHDVQHVGPRHQVQQQACAAMNRPSWSMPENMVITRSACEAPCVIGTRDMAIAVHAGCVHVQMGHETQAVQA